MNKWLLIPLVVLAGAGIPVQVAMNAKLRETVGSPPLTVAIAFLVGALAMALLAATGLLGRGTLAGAGSAPWWSWPGGLFSVAAVLVSILALKQGGAAPVIAGTVFGQLVAAMVIDHFGWLGVEREPINVSKVAGTVLLFAGALLMQRK